MHKIDIGVGDEFPLDEARPEEGRHARWHHHHRWHRHNGHPHHHGHHHGRFHGHRRHGFGGLAILLVIVGIVGLAVQHQLTPAILYGMIGAGALLLVLRFCLHGAWHWRHRRVLAGETL